MPEKRKICVITGSRADYGLLSGVLTELSQADDVQLQLIACGMHLSELHGYTYKDIEKDGFRIDVKIDMLLGNDTQLDTAKSVGIGIAGFAQAYTTLEPDIVVVLGDRFEIWSAAAAALIMCIPLSHIHGGESTEAVIDEAIRHSITKMSQLHFTSTEIYRDRVIQLGEQPDSVFNVGAVGIDAIKTLTLLDRQELEESLDFKLGKSNLLVTYHPTTLDGEMSLRHLSALLDVLDRLNDTHVIFTAANADPRGSLLNDRINTYVEQHSESCVSFVNLGRFRYLSTLRHVDAVVGNSSSGILEAPSLGVATVNIGDRQKGRIKAKSVIDCEPECAAISCAIDNALSKKFQSSLCSVKNPHGEGGASMKIASIVRQHSLTDLLKKEFYDIRCSL